MISVKVTTRSGDREWRHKYCKSGVFVVDTGIGKCYINADDKLVRLVESPDPKIDEKHVQISLAAPYKNIDQLIIHLCSYKAV